MRADRPGRAADERGETLIEVLATVGVVAIAFVAVLGALWSSIRVSDYHRKTTTADVVLRDWAEIMKATGTVAPSGYDATYVPCTVSGGTVTYPTYTPPAPNTDYAATITQIQYLTGYAANGAPTWGSTCPATDRGAQRITLQVQGPAGTPEVRAEEQVTITKRDARNG